jgi:hypothetical protein
LAAALAPRLRAAVLVLAADDLAALAVLVAPDLAWVAVRPAALRALVVVPLAPLLAAARVLAAEDLAVDDLLAVDDERFAAGIFSAPEICLVSRASVSELQRASIVMFSRFRRDPDQDGSDTSISSSAF